MKIKFIILLIGLLLSSVLLFSMRYEYLEPEKVMVVPNSEGNPMLILSDGGYLIRDWSFQPGCYRLIKIGIIQYNLANLADISRCETANLVTMSP
jgi:hypothetical protein